MANQDGNFDSKNYVDDDDDYDDGDDDDVNLDDDDYDDDGIDNDLNFVLAALGPTRSSARSDVWTRPRT